MSRSSIDWLLALMLAVSMGGNAVLGLHYYRDIQDERRAERLRRGVEIGDQLPSLKAKRLNGSIEQVRWSASGNDTVLYVMKADCVWCRRNEANLVVLARDATAHNVVVLSIDKDEGLLTRIAARLPPRAAMFVQSEPETMADYGVRVTPYTLVLSPDGRVKRAWRGAYVSSIAQDIEEFFGIVLPGLTTADGTMQVPAERGEK